VNERVQIYFPIDSRDIQLFEELFSKDIELPQFLTPHNVVSPRFRNKTEEVEDADYLRYFFC